jgi:hypothetical protein
MWKELETNKFSLNDCWINLERSKAIAESISQQNQTRKFEKLHEIRFSNNYQITPESWKIFFRFALKNCSKSLENIFVDNCNLDAKSVAQIIEGINESAEKEIKVKEIDLSRNQYVPESSWLSLMRCIFSKISKNLHTLRLD